MICGSATGEILPPFVVYKGTQMWDIWTMNKTKMLAILAQSLGGLMGQLLMNDLKVCVYQGLG